MANYKTIGSVGPWKAGEIITDKDLADNPQFGGVKRLRDQLQAIEDYHGEIPAVEEPGVPSAPELTQGNDAGRAQAGADVPNAPGHRRGGR